MTTTMGPRAEGAAPAAPALGADRPAGFVDCRGHWHPWTGEEDE